MSTICPNCLRPVRPEAKFCGFCGISLVPVTSEELPAALPSEKPQNSVKQEAITQPKPKRSREQTRRSVLIAIVILLCMVLLAAFLIHYWPTITLYIGSIIGLLGSS
jgi:hypothetical protein